MIILYHIQIAIHDMHYADDSQLGNISCYGHPKCILMPGYISSKDVVLRAVYLGRSQKGCPKHDLFMLEYSKCARL